jgi:L-ribulose-5-phosphate 3-epimerase
VLVVPGAVHIPWRDDHEPVPNDVCDQRAREAVGQLAKQAEKLKGLLNIENIFFNGYLMTPMEMNAFRGQLQQRARARALRHRQHHGCSSIPSTGSRSWASAQERAPEGVHQEGHRLLARNLPPAAGRHDELARVTEALDQTGLRGFLTFEYFHPYPHYPEALIYQTSDSLDRILGRIRSVGPERASGSGAGRLVGSHRSRASTLRGNAKPGRLRTLGG